jgi:hypothetical protein
LVPPSGRSNASFALLTRLYAVYYSRGMTPVRRVTTFRIDDDLIVPMTMMKEQDGIPFSEQIRRGLRMWLESKGALKADRKRAATRKRS